MANTHFVIGEGLTEEDASEEILAGIEKFDHNAVIKSCTACSNRSFKKCCRSCKQRDSLRLSSSAAAPPPKFMHKDGLAEEEASKELIAAIQKEQQKHGISCDGCYQNFKKVEWLKRHQRCCQEWNELKIIRAHLRGEFGWDHIPPN
mmetsp:Transcript_1366/g.2055  ORF Transcript_1366/g.2055 Transcript_1366/m.2055 type:complete len:147 (+) Transcript_1366:182-622(+)